MGVRDVLLGLYGLTWTVVVLLTAWRTGAIPAELWAVLALGVSGLLAAFRADTRLGRKPRGTEGNGDT